MNKRDCEYIAWALHKLSTSDMTLEDFSHEVMALDARIKEDFELFGDGFERDALVEERFDLLMTKELGPGWALSRRCREVSKELFARAKKEIAEENPYAWED